MKPAETVEVSAILWIRGQSPFDIVFGLVQMRVLVSPHEAEIIVSLSGLRRVELDGLLKKLSCFVVEAGAFGGCAVFEEETIVRHVISLRLAFMQSLLEKCD